MPLFLEEECIYVLLKYVYFKNIFAKNTYIHIIFKISFFDSCE